MQSKDISEIRPNRITIGESYDGWINLPAWKGYQSRNGAFSPIGPEGKCDGIINAQIKGSSVDYVYVLSQAQFNAIQYIKNNSDLIRDSLLKSLLKNYPSSKDIYEGSMPDINGIEDYINYIGPSFLHIMNFEKDGFAYYGFELECTWDEEHGVGVMMHKDRVIKVGLADEAFNDLTIYLDNGDLSLEKINLEWMKQKLPIRIKRWWEFWK